MTVKILQGDCRGILPTLPTESVQCVVTSPPYFRLRDYGVEGQIGLESTPDEYVAALVGVFREVRRVLRDDGTVWLNLGTSYASKPFAPWGIKPLDDLMIPHRVAMALQMDGWICRSDIVWHKTNCMPEGIANRPTRSHEYIFLLSKSERYYYDAAAIAEPVITEYNRSSFTHGKTHDARAPLAAVGAVPRIEKPTRNKRSVWTVATQSYGGAHYAVFPEKLIEPCIFAGSSPHACEHCGAPWKRVMEHAGGQRNTHRGSQGQQIHRPGFSHTLISMRGKTTGWQPTCQCDSASTGTGRCIVLDPFAGSGTTLKIATRHGRDSIGIELNPDYIKQAEHRTDGIQTMMEVSI